MDKRSVLRRFATVLSALAIATVMWGCGQAAPTGVDLEQTLASSSADQVTAVVANVDGSQWW